MNAYQQPSRVCCPLVHCLNHVGWALYGSCSLESNKCYVLLRTTRHVSCTVYHALDAVCFVLCRFFVLRTPSPRFLCALNWPSLARSGDV